MQATAQAPARTRDFARVLGPFMIIVPGVVAGRAPDLASYVPAFFGNEALVWETGLIMLLSGLLIIARHQYWSTAPAVIISLFGWFLALRGVVLLGAPHLFQAIAESAVRATTAVQIGFGLSLVLGLWLTHAGWIARPPEFEAAALRPNTP